MQGHTNDYLTSLPQRSVLGGGKGNAMEWTLELVVVPVSDVDYDTQIGDDVRAVQLTPPGSACSIAIESGLSQGLPGSLQGLQLVVSDIEAARAQLVERGVEVSPIRHDEGATLVDGKGGRWNSFILFSDPDGNGWAVQERPTDG
jgi:hypothetical protein